MASEGNVFVAKHTSAPSTLLEYVEYLEDPTGEMTLEGVISSSNQFKPINTQSRGFGYSHSTFWLRFTINFQQFRDQQWFLLQDYEHNKTMDLYVPIDSTKKYQRLANGEGIATSERQFTVRNELFAIPVPSSPTATYYLRITPTIGTYVTADLYFSNQRNTIEHVQSQNLVFGMFYGALIILFLYNLSLWISTKDRGYLLYLYYLGPFIVTFYYINGFAVLVHGTSSWLSNLSRIAVFASLHGMVLFARYFLALKEHAPRLDLALRFCSWLLVTCMVLFGFIIHIEWAYLTSALLILPIFSIVLVAAYYRLFQGYAPARLYCFGWTFLVVNLFIYAFQVIGLISSNAFTNYGLQIGAVIEALCFSIALSDRIKIVQAENDRVKKEKAQLIADKHLYDVAMLEKERKIIENRYDLQTVELRESFEQLALHKENIERINQERHLLINSINSKIEQERRKIASDLHDSLNTVILSIIGQSRRIKDILQKHDSPSSYTSIIASADHMEENANSLYSICKNLMVRLRPEVLEEFGLGVSLQSFVIEQNKIHSSCSFHAHVPDDFPMFNDEFNIVPFRIAQESISNVIQHSKANYCLLRLTFEKCESGINMTLTIADNGVGFNIEAVNSSIGLVGMRERAQSVNGNLNIISKPQHGTVVTFSCMVNSKSSDETIEPCSRENLTAIQSMKQ